MKQMRGQGLSKRSRMARWCCSLLVTTVCSAVAPSWAIAQTCGAYQGTDCVNTSDCPYDGVQKQQLVCITGTCQYPCADTSGNAVPSACSLGETCIPGETNDGDTYYCQVGQFRMDLNLLDSCIYHFVEGIDPSLVANACSLTESLSQLLDQDGNNTFNIYDVDQCIKTFLAEAPCNTTTHLCPALGQVYCASDSECGDGLFCNDVLHRCERECGMIVTRNSALTASLERHCVGGLQVCNYGRGKCVDVDLSHSTCQVDGECPVGAYCFVGQCQPECYRSLDCPDGNWMCNAQNQCVPKPKPNATAAFNPKDYSIAFAEKAIKLDDINDRSQLPVVIMDTRTQQQVVDQPNVVFGYRLETVYGRKLTPQCLGSLDALPPAQQMDCLIEPDEEFVTLENPFGTIFGKGQSAVGVHLNSTAAAKLSPGFYELTLRAIFNNGNQTTMSIRYERPSLSGDYIGSTEVYVGGSTNVLADSNLHLRLNVSKDTQVEWQTLLTENNLAENDEYQDITLGYRVNGYIDGNESTIFTNPGALSQQTNQIAIKGIYSPNLGRMRLMAVIDHAADNCVSEKGSCSGVTGDVLTVKNPFGRKVRRLAEFIGPFDPATRVFSGIYRETFSGLAPSDVTLDGKFRIYQSLQDDGVPFSSSPLLSTAGAVGFPSNADNLAAIDAQVASACNAGNRTTMANGFASKAAFDAMLATYDTTAPALAGNLIRFETTVANALGRLPTDNASKSALTLADFLKGQITFCTGSSGTCIERKDLECGLALFKKAILNGWIVTQNSLSGAATDNEVPLFCTRNASDTTACTKVSANPNVAMLQEHNRFYREYIQTWNYTASNAWSDAFYTMYKAANGDPLDQSAAFAYKNGKMKTAVDAYNSALDAALSPTSTAVLFGWPVKRFQTGGQAWLDELYTISNDRLESVLELIGLRRRILQSGQDRITFAHHVVQYEYLRQAFLAVLQQHWQGSSFKYRGEGRDALLTGQNLLAMANESRNPLGLHPNRVFFENSHLDRTNWQNYRARVQDLLNRTGGTKDNVTHAIEQMKGALATQDAFSSALIHNQQALAAELDERCGAEGTVTPACDKGNFDAAEKEWTCDGADCAAVIERVREAWKAGDVACRTDSPHLEVTLGSTKRPCMGGRVGAILQERAALALQRKTAYAKVGLLVKQIERERQYMEETLASNSEFLDYLASRGLLVNAANLAVRTANAILDEAMAGSVALDCWVIIGLADGTNCPQVIAKAVAQSAATGIRNGITLVQQTALDALALEKELKVNENAMDKEARALRLKMDELVTDVENRIAEFDMINRNLASVNFRMSDELLIAQRTADRSAELVGDIIQKLLGRESGSVLRRNGLIEAADALFQRVLIEAYKMVQAFTYRYNDADANAALTNRVYSATSIADIESLVQTLTDLEETYCGVNGGDCDQENNRYILRFSVQEELFPDLHDIVDPQTNKILTKGEQFHRLITSPTYLKRRKDSAGIITQLEIPFSIWLNNRGTAGGAPRPWMLDPSECNHTVVGERDGTGGTIAANFLGTNLRPTGKPLIEYRLERGDTDYLRKCNSFGINVFTVGWSNESDYGQLNSPPAFFTQSGRYSACINNLSLEDPVARDLQDGCFLTFARDRTLASPDWKLIIPLYRDDNASSDQGWLLGNGVTNKPNIDDVVLYFRHHKRTMSAMAH